MKRYLFVFQKGNGGKYNPVLSVVPQGNHFTGSLVSPCIMKHSTVMKLERWEFLFILLYVKDESSVCFGGKKTQDFLSDSEFVIQRTGKKLSHFRWSGTIVLRISYFYSNESQAYKNVLCLWKNISKFSSSTFFQKHSIVNVSYLELSANNEKKPECMSVTQA